MAVEADDPVPFGYKCCWIAVKSNDADAVVKAMGVVNAKKSTWKAGIAAAYQGQVFVTPAVKGWILVVSIALPEPRSKRDSDPTIPLLTRLGKQFPEVQYFGTHRVVEYHAWQRVVDGKFVRRFAYGGDRDETLFDEGMTEEEKKAGLKFDEDKRPTEQTVMKIAGLWGVNPDALEELKLEKGVGYLGTLPAFKAK